MCLIDFGSVFQNSIRICSAASHGFPKIALVHRCWVFHTKTQGRMLEKIGSQKKKKNIRKQAQNGDFNELIPLPGRSRRYEGHGSSNVA